MIDSSDFELPTADGARLAARWLSPPSPQRTVVLHGATAVPRRFYEPFAEWLAGHAKARVLIYDYRDCGLSVRAGRARASMGDWMIGDQGTALAEAARVAADGPLEVIGHSLGGLGLLFHKEAPRVRRLVAVASGAGYWRNHPLRETPRVAAFWFLLGPATARVLGYVPRQITGFGEHVPREAFQQCRRWCLNPDFHRVDWGRVLPEPNLDAFAGRLRMVGVADDAIIPPASVRGLARFYPAAQAQFALIERADADGQPIGHAGMFKPSRRAAWPKIWEE